MPKKSKEDWVMNVGSSGMYLSKLKEDVPEEILDTLKKSLNKELREIDEHMEEWGWDLDFNAIKSDVINTVVGHYFEWYMMARILKRGHGLAFKKNKLGNNALLITKRGKEPPE